MIYLFPKPDSNVQPNLTRVKNKYRKNHNAQDNLTALIILHSENDILQNIDLNQSFRQFAKKIKQEKNCNNNNNWNIKKIIFKINTLLVLC